MAAIASKLWTKTKFWARVSGTCSSAYWRYTLSLQKMSHIILCVRIGTSVVLWVTGTGRGWVVSGWTTSSVVVMRRLLASVHIGAGVFTTANITRTSPSVVLMRAYSPQPPHRCPPLAVVSWRFNVSSRSLFDWLYVELNVVAIQRNVRNATNAADATLRFGCCVSCVQYVCCAGYFPSCVGCVGPKLRALRWMKTAF